MSLSSRRYSPSRVRELREAAGMTVEQLADAMGMRVWTVVNYQYADRVTPPTRVLPRLADALGVTIDELFEDAS